MTYKHFVFQGPVFVDNIDIGDADEFTASFETEELEFKESQSGQRNLAVSIKLGSTASLSLKMREFRTDNLALAFHGKTFTEAGGDFVHSAPEFVAGKAIFLPKHDVSDVVVTDALAAVLVAGTDYEVTSAKHGTITPLVTKTGTALPISIAADNGASQIVTMLTSTPTPKHVRLNGIDLNTGDSVVAEFWQAKFAPIASMSFIGVEVGEMNVTAKALADRAKSIDGEFGQVGRLVRIGATA